MDDRIESQYHVLTWVIDHAVMAPRLGIDFIQGWPYAPFHEMIVTLPFVARASMLFLSLAVLTSLVIGSPINLQQAALLAGSYVIPSLIMMSGGIPTLELIAKDSLASFQVNMLPLISILPLILAFYSLRKQPRFLSIILVVLMALFMIGYPFIGLLPDEQKRNVAEGAVQIAMIAYVFILTFITRVRNLSKQSNKTPPEKLMP